MWTTMKNTIRPVTDGALSSWRHVFQTRDEHRGDEYHVRRWMRSAPGSLTTSDSVSAAAQLLETDPLVHVPVYDAEGKWLGMVSHRDVIRQLALGKSAEDLKEMRVDEILDVNPAVVDWSQSLSDAVGLMREKAVSCLPVVSNGVFLGVLTEKEILEAVDSFHLEDFSLAA